MKKEFVALTWPDMADKIMIDQALNFVKAGGSYIAVNDGKDLTVGVDVLNMKSIEEKNITSVEPLAPMPIKVKPFEHQIKGYNMALKIMGVIK